MKPREIRFLTEASVFKFIRRHFLFVGVCAAVVMAVAVGVIRKNIKDPYFGGQRISEWHWQLCTGDVVHPGLDLYNDARWAFSRMGPEAVPFLVSQLNEESTGIADSAVSWLRQRNLGSGILPDTVPASKKRRCAAIALGAMGKNAESAIPALIVYTQNSTNPLDQVYGTSGVSRILFSVDPKPGVKPPEQGWTTTAEWLNFRTNVFAEATRRYPGLMDE